MSWVQVQMNRITIQRSTTVSHWLIQLVLLLHLICGEKNLYSNSYTSVSPIQIQRHRPPVQRSIESKLIHCWYIKSTVNDDNDDDDIKSLQQMNHLTSSLFTKDELIVAARQFKIVTCSASSCTAQRKKLSLDDYATFTLFYERLYQNQLINIIRIEETSCLGSCSMAPCVGIEHEDYDGTVALDGMNPSEFQLRTFHHVYNDNDVQRIWDILIQSIKTMAATDVDNDETMYDHPN